MEYTLSELKKAHKEHQLVHTQSSDSMLAENLKLKQVVQSLANDLKKSMETEARNERLSQDKFNDLNKLVNELTKRV